MIDLHKCLFFIFSATQCIISLFDLFPATKVKTGSIHFSFSSTLMSMVDVKPFKVTWPFRCLEKNKKGRKQRRKERREKERRRKGRNKVRSKGGRKGEGGKQAG